MINDLINDLQTYEVAAWTLTIDVCLKNFAGGEVKLLITKINQLQNLVLKNDCDLSLRKTG